jgi:hypothetical protein
VVYISVQMVDHFSVQFNTLYTGMHRNIQDVFNENGVQIMSPAYKGDPADNLLRTPLLPDQRLDKPPDLTEAFDSGLALLVQGPSGEHPEQNHRLEILELG